MIRDNVLESLSGVKGENSVKIVGPDLDELEQYAEKFNCRAGQRPGHQGSGHLPHQGAVEPGVPGRSPQSAPCGASAWPTWKTSFETAVGGQPFTQMIEGERSFDVTLRWPERLRHNEEEILNIPVDVVKNQVTSGSVASIAATTFTGASTGLATTGTSLDMPSITGSKFNATLNSSTRVPRRRLIDLVTPLNDKGQPDPNGKFLRPGASTINREQGNRLIAVKFGVRGRDLASTVAEAQEKTKDLLKPPYRAVWSGEFQQMQEAEARLMWIIPLSLGMILVMLYLAFRSLLDAAVVLSNVVDLSMGGIWALLLTGTHFSISAAVGFISLFGVAIMDGLLMISYFNQLRYHGLPLYEAVMTGAEKARPARDDDGPDRHPRPAAGGHVAQDRRSDAAAAGDRRRGRHDHHAVPDALSDARPVQLLRPSPAVGRVRPHGSLKRVLTRSRLDTERVAKCPGFGLLLGDFGLRFEIVQLVGQLEAAGDDHRLARFRAEKPSTCCCSVTLAAI